jgi:hypothetical protein
MTLAEVPKCAGYKSSAQWGHDARFVVDTAEKSVPVCGWHLAWALVSHTPTIRIGESATVRLLR